MKLVVAIYIVLLVWIDLIQLAITFLLGWPLAFNKRGSRYWINMLVSIDQRVNVLCGGNTDETISSRLGKARHSSRTADFFANIVDTLFFWDEGHCDNNEERVAENRVL